MHESTYTTFLEVAVEAAREAGAMLRADFLKPGGPSGVGSHADADEPAERLIRTRLLTATPTWSYLGEETGRARGADPHHCWVVDPNDGTQAYLRGFRGSAVSIALLRDGVPVLGVVYAYAAPDNEGDLLAWAEGAGPLRRNGVTVTRAPWATALTGDSIMAISQGADRAAAENLACVAPGRFLAEASIAYRLALAAVGDAEIGSSLNSPGAWDYGGGHALLLSQGGLLVNETGHPVTYTTSGASHTQFCFGGAPDLVVMAAARPWHTALAAVRAPSAASVTRYRRCWPARGNIIAADGVLQRAQGCLLGQLAGDALGSMVEFQSASLIQSHYPQGLRKIGPSPVWGTLAGQPTDDSELALVLARALLQTSYVDEQAADAYGYWRQSGPFDVGGTIGTATGAILHAPTGQKAQAARMAANKASQANGALMRQSPLALWGHALPPAALAEVVRADTTLTHPHDVCQDASAAFIVALAAVIAEGLTAEEAHARACTWHAEHGTSVAVGETLAAARQGPPPYRPQEGWVLIALRNAFYQALHAPTLEEGLIATVMGGGDSDTNGAIAGALLGAIHGARALPAQWKQAVLTCRPQEGLAGVERPRPQAFWPVDALYLAEGLLVAGRAAV